MLIKCTNKTKLCLRLLHICTAQGRSNYSAKLDLEGEAVAFTPSGDAYLLTCGTKVGGVLSFRDAAWHQQNDVHPRNKGYT